MFNRFAKMFNQTQRIWAWSLIVTVTFALFLKYVSEIGAIVLLICYIFTSGHQLGIFDIPKRKPTKHNSRFWKDGYL